MLRCRFFLSIKKQKGFCLTKGYRSRQRSYDRKLLILYPFHLLGIVILCSKFAILEQLMTTLLPLRFLRYVSQKHSMKRIFMSISLLTIPLNVMLNLVMKNINTFKSNHFRIIIILLGN
jgi:hypothetical protein